MPSAKYLKLYIDQQQLELSKLTDAPVTISYRLEDPQNFQSKKSSDSRSIEVPATRKNDQIFNTFHNPEVEDATPADTFRGFRSGIIEANGYELLIGKALLTDATHTDRPETYQLDFYGNNGDWIVGLQEATLYDFLKQLQFDFTKQMVIDSWAFDGKSEDLPYVFAPVRFGQPMESFPANFVEAKPPMIPDMNMRADYMRPSLSIYWILFWGFKSLGYRISSDFMDTAYFRRMVMPWTWGNFLYSDGTRLDNLDFLAKSRQRALVWNTDFDGYVDAHITADPTLATGAFDNNGSFSYDGTAFEMKWTYLPAFDYGTLEAAFHFSAFVDITVTANSNAELRIHWYKNGVQVYDEVLAREDAPTVGRRDFLETVDSDKTFTVVSGDVISAKLWVHTFDSGLGRANISVNVDAFELDYFRIPIGGVINFEGYSALKKYKFLDLLAGVLDAFNISPQTDPVNKVVTLEPLHPYSLSNDLSARSGGYLTGNTLTWNNKQDLKVRSTLSLFSDNEREMIFQFKDDSNDGLLKKVKDRSSTSLAEAKYAFPDRFKAGKKEVENRFFSPTIHAELKQWRGFGTDPDACPQIVCMVPENVSNTSRDAAQNTFEPKICFYKGVVDHVGWKFDGLTQNNYPYMFAVNYQPGGEQDPVLSYCDERIGKEDEYVIAKGLLRRFFLQRMAIMRNGQYYTTSFRLKNIDISNWLHREHIICRGNRWELVEIREYAPLQEKSTECYMRKSVDVAQRDADNVFPSPANVLGSTAPAGEFDIQYYPLKCLSSDIPTEITN